MANNNRNFKEQQQGKKIVIAERDNIAAVLENGKVTDFFIHRGDVLLGDVYLATVDNILPSIDAAFVNVGTDKMGFLHAQDVMGKGTLKEKLKPKQKLIVQVVKEPTGHKGPRVTTEISLPGRFLVLMPYEPGVSVSKKIENSRERARLKAIMNLIKPVGVGVIIRTEAEGQSEADIQEDLEILLEKWNNIITSAETLNPPNLIYRDQDLLYRVIREACTEDVKEIVVDTAFALSRVQNILQNWHMNKNIEVTLYKGTEPLLIAYDIHKEIKAALNVKVNMPSGGYLFIQQTEALTVIDVNSGKFTSSSTQDETILKTNIEAVHEIARQLRLRNIGGMIIVDFIDMMSRADKLAMLEELEIALEPDKAKPQVGQLSDLGLVELTRHRQGQSLSEIFTKKCPHCQGSGCSVIDFNFATPTAEGEYRAKAAKLKLPVNNFKKNNNNKQNNKPQVEETPAEIQEQIPTPEIQVENPSVIAVQEVENTDKKRKGRKTRFDKKKTEQVETPLAVTDEVHTAETVLKVNEEIKPEIAEEVLEAKSTKTEKPLEVQAEAEPVAEQPAATEESAETQSAEQPSEEEVKEEKPKRTRRPNRGTSKRTRTKKTKSEEKVETEES
ncbi:TPA: Rne/Rng family ribonuclease [Candidatus Scatousia excrementigallinarum]|uniref:Rne/Rng family ribonuclease n=1 Tax=Candidatus Scatousia excrementigallinarum TaxID=2840935 RepID=A0A9D1EYZ7_9BACT|nr:Rne/Rng family ribonuclease [Candidatus Scatousia excrementigallinarum]